MARKIVPLKYKSPMRYNTRLHELRHKFDLGVAKLEGMEGDISKNFYEGLTNPYAGLTDQMANVENTAEEITIDTRAADYLRQQQQQQQANILSSMRGAAGASGGAALAQQMANLGSQQAQQASAKISEQEVRGKTLRAQQAQQLSIQKAQSAQQVAMQKAQGAFQVDMQKRQGEQDVLSRQLNMQQALLGLTSGQMAYESEQKSLLGWKKWLRF
tara:strand:+ start:164 stop:808 length:645 start_codon:yes stop_codon:yes gene_type:complete